MAHFLFALPNCPLKQAAAAFFDAAQRHGFIFHILPPLGTFQPRSRIYDLIDDNTPDNRQKRISRHCTQARVEILQSLLDFNPTPNPNSKKAMPSNASSSSSSSASNSSNTNTLAAPDNKLAAPDNKSEAEEELDIESFQRNLMFCVHALYPDGKLTFTYTSDTVSSL
jgi:hypothetical protein